jgi:hypothetical protein
LTAHFAFPLQQHLQDTTSIRTDALTENYANVIASKWFVSRFLEYDNCGDSRRQRAVEGVAIAVEDLDAR